MNGYDTCDSASSGSPSNEVFKLTYLGVLSEIQNPDKLWEALHEIVEEDPQFKAMLEIDMVGQIDQSAVASLQNHGLTSYTKFTPYIPHSQVSDVQKSSSVLLLLLMPSTVKRAKGLLTGKMFEYLSSGRPILCIGPEDGDAAHIIEECHAGMTVDFEDKEKMKEAVKELFRKHQEGSLEGCDAASIEKYSRKALAKDYVELINQIAP